MKKLLLDETTGVLAEPKPEVEEINETWFRRPANFKLGQFDKDRENKREKSLTIPNMGYTVREILEKFTRGVPLDIEKEGLFDEPNESEMDEFENVYDITEVVEKHNILRNKIAVAEHGKVKGVVKGAEVKSPDITKHDKESDISEMK